MNSIFILSNNFSGIIEKEQVEYYSVAEETRLGCGDKLFDFLAECIADFVHKNLEKGHPQMPLGFTFSFPMEQTGLNKGVLVSWTKSFNAAGPIAIPVVAFSSGGYKLRMFFCFWPKINCS